MHNTTSKTDQDPIILVNIIEEFVRQKTKETIRELGACNCDTCFFNACAIALNKLEPKYVTTTRGTLLSQINEMRLDHQTKILVEVTKAVKQVTEHPHH